VLFRALRAAVTTLRAAGWRAFALAFAYLAPIGVLLPRPELLLIIGLTLLNIVTFAVIRHLAAFRPRSFAPPGQGADEIDADRPPPPPSRPGPIDASDRRPVQALRHAALLVRPALRLGLVQLCAYAGVAMLLLIAGGDQFVADENMTHHEQLILVAGLAPLIGLVLGFIALAAQHIAIEGDTRVVIAVAHSLRIARTSFGAMFALSLAEPALLVAELAVGPSLGTTLFALVAHPLLRLFVVAALNEVYADGPRFDVPLTPARTRPKL
jgi:hypothetical protein